MVNNFHSLKRGKYWILSRNRLAPLKELNRRVHMSLLLYSKPCLKRTQKYVLFSRPIIHGGSDGLTVMLLFGIHSDAIVRIELLILVA